MCATCRIWHAAVHAYCSGLQPAELPTQLSDLTNSFPNLRALDLSACANVRYGRRLKSLLQGSICTQLEQLTVGVAPMRAGAWLANSAIRDVAHCPALRSLAVLETRAITSTGLAALTLLSGLQV